MRPTTMHETVSSLLAALMPAQTFEDAAFIILRRMLDLAGEALTASRYARRGALLRGMVHFRPLDGYRKLAVLERGATAVEPLGEQASSTGAAYLPSATAWRWVAKHRCAVAIDVHAGRIQPDQATTPLLVRDKHLLGGTFDSRESTQRLLERAASHLYVLPLRSPGGSVDGMLSLEAECQGAIGQAFIWLTCGERLQLLTDVAAPYLAQLPPCPVVADAPDDLLPVIGASMAELIRMVRVFAEQDETILLGGPTGAGKSRLARWSHEKSRRRTRKFEALDLMTVPDELQMGELFGWRKGAFSGAVMDNPGSIARADGGTLFIDEIDKLSLKAQAGLLQVLEERRYRSLGEGGERRADVRFIVGSNADLQAAVQEGRFREDLYYRINVLPVKIPPLDERLDELPRWASYMALRRHRETIPEGHADVSEGANRLLVQSRWPGNLRQLDNIIRRAYAFALVEAAGAPREIVLEERHVARALHHERSPGGPSLLHELERAAVAFVAEAERHGLGEAPLDLDLTEALRGFVMGVAARKLGSKEAAFRLFGRGAIVGHRNHHKVFKRELERIAALGQKIGFTGELPFGDLRDDADE